MSAQRGGRGEPGSSHVGKWRAAQQPRRSRIWHVRGTAQTEDMSKGQRKPPGLPVSSLRALMGQTPPPPCMAFIPGMRMGPDAAQPLSPAAGGRWPPLAAPQPHTAPAVLGKPRSSAGFLTVLLL